MTGQARPVGLADQCVQRGALTEAEQYRFGDLIYEIDDRSERVVSRWPDGATLTALPNYDEESAARAEALGYGTHANPVWAMTRDHDAVHHLVARALGAPWSEHLRAVALGEPSPDGDEEERLVLLVQRAMTSGGSLSRLAGHPTMTQPCKSERS